MNNEKQRRWAMLLLAAVVLAAALKFAQPVLAPMTLAFVMAVVLSPLKALWQRIGLGETSASVMAALVALLVLALSAILLQPIASDVVAQWPEMKSELMSAMHDLRQSVRGLYNLQAEVMNAIDPANATAPASSGAGDSIPTLADAALFAPQIAGQVLVFLAGVFFFLLCRTDFYGWLAQFISKNTDGAPLTVEDFTESDRVVTQYFTTVTLINAGFGTAVAIGLSLIGLPGAIIWGLVAALMNFVVYLGAAITAVLLVLAGTVSFDGWHAMLPAAIFVGLNFLEGQFVTPQIVGKTMHLNPLLVFVALTLAIFLWGAIGGIVAIPLIVWGMALNAAYQRPDVVSDAGEAASATVAV